MAPRAVKFLNEHFFSWMLAGGGMCAESYVLFSVGNLHGIFKKAYPACWGDNPTECTTTLTKSNTYTQISGLIIGMLVLAFIADRIGRRIGSIMTTSAMSLGITIVLLSIGSPSTTFTIFIVGLFVFGMGVGGEYPVASASASERAAASREKRGKTVVLTFSMQGVGNWLNTVVIFLLLVAVGQTGTDYNRKDLEIVWRVQYGIAAVGIFALLAYRIIFLRESAVWLALRRAQREAKREGAHKSRSLLKNLSETGHELSYHWSRLIGTAIGWLVWDIAFYGNKLFQGTFIRAFAGKDASIFTVLAWTILNSTIALTGYYASAFTIDRSWMGRWRMQLIGFSVIFVIFLICAVLYTKLTDDLPHLFQVLYYITTFFGQFGPNTTTWLLPGELYPTPIRSTAHGISAASGKVGALIAGVLFEYVGDHTKFYICAGCGVIGAIVTFLFVPDVSTMKLGALDEWQSSRSEKQIYRGHAVNPRHLSIFEKYVLRMGSDFNEESAENAPSEIIDIYRQDGEEFIPDESDDHEFVEAELLTIDTSVREHHKDDVEHESDKQDTSEQEPLSGTREITDGESESVK